MSAAISEDTASGYPSEESTTDWALADRQAREEYLDRLSRGHWDRRGQGEWEGVSPAFKDFVVETRITSSAPLETIRATARTTHARCPMHASIARIGPVVHKLFVNGTEVPL